jgi:hypothetical protein
MPKEVKPAVSTTTEKLAEIRALMKIPVEIALEDLMIHQAKKKEATDFKFALKAMEGTALKRMLGDNWKPEHKKGWVAIMRWNNNKGPQYIALFVQTVKEKASIALTMRTYTRVINKEIKNGFFLKKQKVAKAPKRA